MENDNKSFIAGFLPHFSAIVGVIKQKLPQEGSFTSRILEQVLAVVEGSFYNLRDDVLNAEQLFEMRIRLQDSADAIAEACQYIARLQQAVETESAE